MPTRHWKGNLRFITGPSAPSTRKTETVFCCKAGRARSAAATVSSSAFHGRGPVTSAPSPSVKVPLVLEEPACTRVTLIVAPTPVRLVSSSVTSGRGPRTSWNSSVHTCATPTLRVTAMSSALTSLSAFSTSAAEASSVTIRVALAPGSTMRKVPPAALPFTTSAIWTLAPVMPVRRVTFTAMLSTSPSLPRNCTCNAKPCATRTRSTRVRRTVGRASRAAWTRYLLASQAIHEDSAPPTPSWNVPPVMFVKVIVCSSITSFTSTVSACVSRAGLSWQRPTTWTSIEET
mmetsp:Transcript_5099/g.11756  ORF Transcript_5099/g.11756 Transcript_5099/m.11756 type:complete len:289 (+) Transcript_5099:81-947(+)